MCSLKNLKLIKMLAVAALFTSISAFAGTKDGGGGGAYVCRNADGSIKSAMLADIWEVQFTPFRWPNGSLYLHITYGNDSAEAQFSAALAKLQAVDPTFANRVREERARIFANKHSLWDGVSIALPDDLKLGYFPTGCPPEGMMYYNNESDRLDVKEDIFAAQNVQTSVAASWMHEAVYKVLREKAGHESSKYARRLVGCLFSEDSDCLLSPALEVPSDRLVYECKSDHLSMKVFPNDAHIKEPKDLLKGKIFLRGVISKLDKLALGFQPVIEIESENWNNEMHVRQSPRTLGGMSHLNVSSRVDLFQFQVSRESGEFSGFTFASYEHFINSPGVYGPDAVRVDEVVNCKRVH